MREYAKLPVMGALIVAILCGMGAVDVVSRRSACYTMAHVGLSYFESRAGHPHLALAHADHAVRCNPELALTHHRRSAAFAELGQVTEALDELRLATALAPADTRAKWSETGQFFEDQGAWTAAASTYSEAAALFPNDPEGPMLAGLLYQYRLGDAEQAIPRYRTVLERLPTHYGAHYQLALALLSAGRQADAVAAWRDFLPLAAAIDDRASVESAPAALRGVAKGR